MDTEKRRWEEAAGIWNDEPKEILGVSLLDKIQKRSHSSDAKTSAQEPQPHYIDQQTKRGCISMDTYKGYTLEDIQRFPWVQT